MQNTVVTIYNRLFSSWLHPPPNHTVVIIVDWMTAKENYEENPTSSSFIRYQSAISNLLKDEEARYVMTQLLLACRPIAGD
jgi:hypothetical protein